MLENAAKRGATHIHWMSNDESFMAIHMTAEAFDCTARDRTTTNESNEDGNKSERVPVARDRVTAEHSGEAREPGTQDAAASVPNGQKSANPTISTGTCFFTSSSGLALSSLHVVKGHPKIIIVDARGRRSSANVLAADDQLDLVALQVDLESVPQALALSTKEASLGDAVFTIGFPEVVDLGFRANAPLPRSTNRSQASRPRALVPRNAWWFFGNQICRRRCMLSVIPQSLSSIVMSFPTRSRISVPPIAIIVGSYGVKCTAQRSRSYCGVTPRSLRGVSS